MLPNDLSSVERDEEIECSMQLVDTTKSRKYAGSLKVYLSSKQDYDKAAIENYLLGDFGNQAEMDKEILDTADRDEEEQFQHYRNYEWVLATCSEANAYSEFNLVEVDVNEREVIVNYGEMFAFEHRLTKQRLKLADMVGFVDCVPQWWEYQSDMALVPVYTRPGAILDAEVCQFERVDVDEVIDILYCSRFISIARACTASLQLSARAEHLYKPMFRHFQRSLQTLVLWTLGEIESDSCLCNDASGGDERKEENANVADQVEDNAVVIPDLPSGRKGSFYQAAASPSSSSRKLRQMLFGSAKEATAAEGDSSQFALGMSFVNAIGLGNGFQRGYHVPEDQLKDEDEEVGSIVDSSSSRSVSDAPSSRASSRNDEIIDNGISVDESEEASEVGEEIVEDVNTSSLAPWIGRTILRGTALFGDDNDVHSDLHRYASHVLHEFLSKNVPMNAVLYRRFAI